MSCLVTPPKALPTSAIPPRARPKGGLIHASQVDLFMPCRRDLLRLARAPIHAPQVRHAPRVGLFMPRRSDHPCSDGGPIPYPMVGFFMPHRWVF